MKIEDLNLSALKYFIDAVEFKSISKSAIANNVSRPAVSQAISRLELWYGKRLLMHIKKSFELTREGREFYVRAKKSFKDLHEGLSTKTPDSKSFKVGCSASLIDLVFPKIENILKKAEDPIIKIGKTDQLIKDLEDGSIHVAFVLDNGKANHLEKSEFKSGKFVCLSKSAKFQNHLITTESRPEVDSFLKFLLKNKTSFSSHITVESWSVGVQLAQLNLGCCLVPDYIKHSSLKLVETKKWNAAYSAVVVTRKDQILSPMEEEIFQNIIKN